MQQEYKIQCEVFKWSEWMQHVYPCLFYMYASPVGQSLHIAQAVAQKRKGVKKGVPDICLPYPVYNRHGLYIELKAVGGKVSSEQQEWIDYLNKVGYYACVCVGYEETVDTIEKYIKGML